MFDSVMVALIFEICTKHCRSLQRHYCILVKFNEHGHYYNFLYCAWKNSINIKHY